MATDVDAVTDELYALPPGTFTSSRDAEVKKARAAGDKAAATRIAALRRPTVVAWLANQLARQHADEVEPLVALGEALRVATATLSGPALRELSRQRQQLVHALVQQARAMAEGAGQRVTEDAARGLEDTLHAALADPDDAARLVEGRLTDAMARTGFGSGPTGAAVPPAGGTPARGRPARGTPPKRTPPKRTATARATRRAAEDRRRAGERARLESELGEAWAVARSAADAREEADTEDRTTKERRTSAQREVERLRSALARAESELVTAQEAADQAQTEKQQGTRAADEARQRVSELRSRLDEL